MSSWGLLITILLFFGGGWLYRIFVPNDPDVISLGILYLKIIAFVQIPQCLEGVAAGIFRGKGKTIPPSISSISSNILRVVLAYASVHFTDLGLSGIWYAISISAAIRGLWVLTWYLFSSRKEPKSDTTPEELATEIEPDAPSLNH